MSLDTIIANVTDVVTQAYEQGRKDQRAEFMAKLSDDKPAVKKAVAKPRAKTKPKSAKKPRVNKSTMVREIIQRSLKAKPSISRDEVLQAAQHMNPDVTKYDVGNAVLSLKGKVETSPDHTGMIFRPGEVNSSATAAN